MCPCLGHSLMSPSVAITEELVVQLLDATFSPGDETLGVIRQVCQCVCVCMCLCDVWLDATGYFAGVARWPSCVTECSATGICPSAAGFRKL